MTEEIVQQIEQPPEQPVKRGRGRPRIHPPKDPNAPKRPRGRPRTKFTETRPDWKPLGRLPRVRKPEVWSAIDIYMELNRRLNLGYDTQNPADRKRLKLWFYGQIKMGKVERGKLIKPMGITQLWTEQQAQEIFATYTAAARLR